MCSSRGCSFESPRVLKVPTANTLEIRDVRGGNPGGEAVHGVTADLSPGCFHLLRGPDGGGKAALLRLLGLLERPESGEVVVRGLATSPLSDEARAELRTQRFGFVFAAPFLLSSFSVIENVAMPLFKISQVTPEEARRRTESMLHFVGLAESAEWPVDELPLLAQYQVAVARGMINEPSFLLVENLDGALVGEDVSAFATLLHRVTDTYGTTVIATASPAVPLRGRLRVLDIADGLLASDTDLFPENLS